MSIAAFVFSLSGLFVKVGGLVSRGSLWLQPGAHTRPCPRLCHLQHCMHLLGPPLRARTRTRMHHPCTPAHAQLINHRVPTFEIVAFRSSTSFVACALGAHQLGIKPLFGHRKNLHLLMGRGLFGAAVRACMHAAGRHACNLHAEEKPQLLLQRTWPWMQLSAGTGSRAS